jgi:acylphosphatase
MVCCRFIVSGRVQGVFFRDRTRNVALPLGITGHAANKADGTVEVLACGAEGAVRQLEDWLHEGPQMAMVEAVEKIALEKKDCVSPHDFHCV